jgi:hypothetical protein
MGKSGGKIVRVHTTHALSPKGCRDVSDISQRHPNFTKMTAMRNTAEVTGGKPIAICLQSISGVCAVNEKCKLLNREEFNGPAVSVLGVSACDHGC